MLKCSACGSSNVQPGVLGSAAVWLDQQSAWSRALRGAEVKVTACLDCGHLTLRAAPDELRQLLK